MKITNWHIHPAYVAILKKDIKICTFLFHVLNKLTPTRIHSGRYYYNSNTIRTIRSPSFYDFSCYLHNNTSYFNIITIFFKIRHLLIAKYFRKYIKYRTNCAPLSLINYLTPSFTKKTLTNVIASFDTQNNIQNFK